MSSDGHVPSVASDPDPEPREPDADLEPDRSPVQLRRELRLRVQGLLSADEPAPDPDRPGASQRPPDDDHTDPNGSTHPMLSAGRHARRDGQSRPPRLDYVPRHAVRTPGPGSVSPNDKTEVFSRVRRDPTERPLPARPESEPLHARPSADPVPEQKTAEPPPAPAEPITKGKRERVVLAQRKGQARPVRTVVEVQDLTQVGEVLSSSLIGSQLGLSVRFGAVAVLALGSLPALFAMFPVLGRFELFGLRVPWLLLGVLAYPFFVLLGWLYTRSADKIEQVFADHIQS
ncbi:hypothetical protein [Pseudonocardia acaciae]|uniref:hypothetical protein n=1 Tax=Pseudonocardia acaciae TaxID=551276 RepID=UPI001B802927|nr:hypothetical protein [Pseudonocardia acaciae]